MDVTVVTKAELASFISTPYDKVARIRIVKLNQAPVFDCNNLLCSYR